MKYLSLLLLLLPVFTYAFTTDEVCNTGVNISIEKIEGINVEITKKNCEYPIARISNLPFDIRLSLSVLGDYAEINMSKINFAENKSYLKITCNVFPTLVEIMANGKEFSCKELKKEPLLVLF